jgi:integrating conjugative element protein (TIGR03755 family)
MKARKRIIALLLAVLMLHTSTFSLANEAYRLNTRGEIVDDRLMYSIGGGSVVSGAAAYRPNNYYYGLGVRWNANLMCGNFDLQATIRNQLNGVVDGFKDIMGGILSAATGAVASLPALILQRANPGLYELISNGIMQARIDFDRSKLTCENMGKAMADALTSSEWGDISSGMNLQDLIKWGSVDAIATTKHAESNRGQSGIDWVGGSRKGGIGQDRIYLIRDTVFAGHQMLSDRWTIGDPSVTVTSPPCDGAVLCTTWPNAQQAMIWADKVLGDSAIQTCQDCGPLITRAGSGLTPLIQETYAEKLKTIEDLLNGNLQTTPDNLKKASSGMLPVSRRVIEAMRDDSDREVLSRRLASEVAMSDTLEKALLLQRVLQAGAREPAIAQVKPAQEQIHWYLKHLSDEIASLKLEMDIRQGLAHNTASAILRRQEAALGRSRLIESGDPDRDRILQMERPTP